MYGRGAVRGIIRCLDCLWRPMMDRLEAKFDTDAALPGWHELNVPALQRLMEAECHDLIGMDLSRVSAATTWLLENARRLWSENAREHVSTPDTPAGPLGQIGSAGCHCVLSFCTLCSSLFSFVDYLHYIKSHKLYNLLDATLLCTVVAC